PTACTASWFHSRTTLADSRHRSSNGSTLSKLEFLSRIVKAPPVCGRMGMTSRPARRPSAGAVPGRRGACLAVRAPPAALLGHCARGTPGRRPPRLRFLYRFLRLRAPPGRLVRLVPGVVELHEPPQRFGAAGPVRRGNFPLSFLHGPVGPQQKRLGVGVL